MRICLCQRRPNDIRVIAYNLQNKQQQTPGTLTKIQYECHVINNILKMTVNQTFKSVSPYEYSESVYLFPLSEEICLESFSAQYQDKNIKGIVKSKQAAQQEYQENMQEGNLVSYAELKSDDKDEYLKISLGNLPPNEEVKITITFSQQLQTYLNKYYLVNIPVIHVEDEVEAKLGQNILTLNISCTNKIISADCIDKKNAIDKNTIDEFNTQFKLYKIENKEHYHFKVLFAFEGMFEPQVIYGQSKIYEEDKVKQALLPVRESIMVSFLPDLNQKQTQELDDAIKASLNNGEDIVTEQFEEKMNEELIDHIKSSKSEYIFLIDRSGSMKGKPIQKALEALQLFLQSLPPNSYFNVYGFGSSYRKLYQQSQKYSSQTLKFACEKIKNYDADLNGTDILSPLNEIFNYSQKIKGYSRQIFVLTDGAVQNRLAVIQQIKKNNKRNRVHFIGLGSSADKILIEESAVAGKGIYEMVSFDQDLSSTIIKILYKTITATLDKFQVSYDKELFEAVYPDPANIPFILKEEIFNLHFFLPPLVKLDEISEEKKIITIQYYDSSIKKDVVKQIKLLSSDSFTCNQELKESVFKLGKLQQITYQSENHQINLQQAEQQAIDYQLITNNTALICLIQQSDDSQKAQFQSLPKQIYISNKLFHNFTHPYRQKECFLLSTATTTSSSSSYDLNNARQKVRVLAKCASSQPRNQIGVLRPQSSLSYMQTDAPMMRSMKDEKQLKSSSKICENFNQQQIQESSQVFEECKTSSLRGLQEKPSKPEKMKASYEIKKFKENKKAEKIEKEDEKQDDCKYMKLEQLLSLADSEGVLNYDEKIIKQFISSQFEQLIQLDSQFKNKNIMMTILFICLLEKLYSSQKQKWILISKKSVSTVKEQVSLEQFNKLKENIYNIIQV